MGRTGLSTQIALAEESTYGTPASLVGAAARLLEAREESIEDNLDRIESEGMRAGRSVTQQWKNVRKGAGGNIVHEVAQKGGGVLLKHALGAAATTTPVGGTASKTHTASIGPLFGKSLTVQVARGNVTTGANDPFTYHGGKVNDWELACEPDGLALLTLGMDFEESDTVTALSTAAYPSSLELFDFTQAVIKVGGVNLDVSSLSLKGDNQLKADRYFLRGSALKKEPLEDTAPRELTCDLTGEYDGTAQAWARFVNGTEATLQVTFTGSILEAAVAAKLDINAGRVRWDGGTPNAGGPDVIEQPHSIKILAPTDGSNPLTAAYTTLDLTP